MWHNYNESPSYDVKYFIVHFLRCIVRLFNNSGFQLLKCTRNGIVAWRVSKYALSDCGPYFSVATPRILANLLEVLNYIPSFVLPWILVLRKETVPNVIDSDYSRICPAQPLIPFAQNEYHLETYLEYTLWVHRAWANKKQINTYLKFMKKSLWVIQKSTMSNSKLTRQMLQTYNSPS